MKGFWRILVALMGVIGCWAIAPGHVFAQTDGAYVSNQAMALSASLVAPDPAMEIPIYPEPSQRQPRIGYGLNGDPVTVVEQTGSNDGTTWNRVQFKGAEDAEGWVQSEFLAIQQQASPQATQQGNATPNRYLGNRRGRSPSASQPFYPQHNQQHQTDQRRNYR